MIYRFQLNRQLAIAEAHRLQELDTVKTRLYTNITHEFRTPLTIILGMVDQVKDDPANWFNEGLQLIKRNGNQLLHLVNQLLDLSKLESGNMPLNYVHNDIVAFLKYLAESFHSYADSKDIRLHFLTKLPETVMDYDPEKMQNIVSNLLVNAIKFTPAGGDVYMTLKIEDTDRLLLSIRDTGMGISAEKLPFIFDRFYQVDSSTTRQGEGTGIGLSLCKEFVKLMGGRIEAESEVGNGSIFTIRLPILHQHKNKHHKQVEVLPTPLSNTVLTDQQIATNKNVNLLGAKRPLLLLIEDNPDVITYLSAILMTSYDILTATNGQKGIEQALEQIPDLIVSDVMMPEKDDFEVCETLKEDERTSHIPIILLTAKADQSDRIAGLSHGADVYLSKPFHKEELLIRIQKLIELRQALQKRFKRENAIQEIIAKKRPDAEELFLQRMIRIVENHISDENFGMPELCRQAGLGRTQLFRKLKAITGKSATRFIRSIRLEKAKTLLQTTDLNVSEVAYQTGFGNPSYFSRVFLEEFEMPPSKVRDL